MGTVGGGRTVHGPLMRPLTPSSVGPSLHQIEHQLLEAEVQLENYTSGLIANFEMMRCQPVAQAQPLSTSPPGVTCDQREGRERALGLDIGDLREKALHNGYSKDSFVSRPFTHDEGRGYLEDSIGQVVAYGDEEERLSAVSEERRPASGHGSRPSTRGSRWGRKISIFPIVSVVLFIQNLPISYL